MRTFRLNPPQGGGVLLSLIILTTLVSGVIVGSAVTRSRQSKIDSQSRAVISGQPGGTDNGTGNGTAQSCHAITTASECDARPECVWSECPHYPASHGCFAAEPVLIPVCPLAGNITPTPTPAPPDLLADLACSIRVQGRLLTTSGDNVRLCLRIYNYGESDAPPPIGYTIKMDPEIYTAVDIVEYLHETIPARGTYGRISSREVCRTLRTAESRFYTGIGSVDPENNLPESNEGNNSCYTDTIQLPEPSLTLVPTVIPTVLPTATLMPTAIPTAIPTLTPLPTIIPSDTPTPSITQANLTSSILAGDRNNNCKVDSIDVSWFLEYYGKTVDTSRGRVTITPRVFAAMLARFGTNICTE